nr:MAG TPA: hypothetical protein [Caudoviricetes sp.]
MAHARKVIGLTPLLLNHLTPERKKVPATLVVAGTFP